MVVRSILVGCLIFCGLYTSKTIAELPIAIDVVAPERSIVPGEPLYAEVQLRCLQPPGEKVGELISASLEAASFEVSLHNKDGKLVGVPPEEPWYPAGNGFYVVADLAPGEIFRKTLILNWWFATDIEPGEYELAIRLKSIGIREAEGNTTKRQKLPSEANTWKFPLTFTEPNDEVVKQRFGALLERSLTAEKSPESFMRALFASDSIIFARGPLAVPYQLELLQKTKEGEFVEWGAGRMLHLFRRFAHSDHPETASELVEFSQSNVFLKQGAKDESTRGGMWELLLWAIHEMHEHGGPDVSAITAPVLASHGDVRAPRMSDYFDTSGPMENY